MHNTVRMVIKKEVYKSHKLCTESSKSELARVYINI